MATTTWSFTSGYEEWTFRDDSNPPGTGSATRTYDATNESIENLLVLILGTFRTAIGVNVSPAIGASVLIGDSIEIDFSAVQGAPTIPPFGHYITAFFTDMTSEQSSIVGTAAGTLTHVFTVNKTLDYIEVKFDRGAGGGPQDANHSIELEEVRLITVAPIVVGDGEKPLEMDIDLSTGSKIWATKWDTGGLYLQEYSSNLAIQNTFPIATGTTSTIFDVNNRTYYLSPYTPPFFGTASLDDIIYIYGRWDNGGVTHLSKSIDGGSSFSDIGDSGTWGTGWVGSFFADDTNTLYAFVNGSSRTLYRSINAGVTWTSLSILPFDIDPGGMSKHPDGRILIVNRNAGAAMVAYAEPPDYSVWFDATGTPSFPLAGGGSNSVIWIT